MPRSLEKSSPCKVNLLLNILGRRPDGFHELETVMHPVAVCDLLGFATGGQGIELTCTDPALPTDQGNLVHRAAAAFLQAAGISDGVKIHLEKKIPLAAGLGGGSGNAAVTLLGLNELFDQPLPANRLAELAATLGSDVPFFLQSQPALALGRGEKITPCNPFPAMRDVFFLLIHPGFGISTAWAYQNLARFPDALNGQPGRAGQLVKLLEGSSLSAAVGEFYNSLEAPALEKFPLLVILQEFLRSNGALAALMSGSGSTTFALAGSRKAAEELADAVKAKFGAACWTAVAPI
jgi:4-diphosphocytidyl-2-C-methyl-D-erythritol kinase